METIYRVLIDRAERGMADLLLTIADHFYCLGAGLPSETTDAGLRDLLTTLEQRHRAEILAMRGWIDGPRLADELPGWLLSLPQQADPERVRAYAERQIALGDATPPEGWVRAAAQEGKP